MKIQWNKVTWYSKLAAVILGVIIFALGIYIGSMYQKGRDAIEWSQQLRIERPIQLERKTTVQKVEKQYEFTATGNIKNNATGAIEADEWVLIYEQPGAPALTKGLVFTTASRCVMSAQADFCNTALFNAGQRVKVMGHADPDGNIIIEQLELVR